MNMEHVHKLTKDEVKALKTCDHIVFYYDEEQAENKGYIRVIKEVKRDVWGKQEKRIEIETGNEIYGKDSGKVKKCFYYINDAEFTHWPTIAENIKEGDRLVIRWSAGSNNQYLDNAGLFADEVYLYVYREGKAGMKVKKYFVGYVVCENNTARMIKAF